MTTTTMTGVWHYLSEDIRPRRAKNCHSFAFFIPFMEIKLYLEKKTLEYLDVKFHEKLDMTF